MGYTRTLIIKICENLYCAIRSNVEQQHSKVVKSSRIKYLSRPLDNYKYHLLPSILGIKNQPKSNTITTNKRNSQKPFTIYT